MRHFRVEETHAGVPRRSQGDEAPIASIARSALVVAVLLAGVTGFVDTVSFDRFLGVFPANQSGNAVFLGMAIGGSGDHVGWQSGTAMAGFALGISAAEVVRRRVRATGLGARLGAVLLGGGEAFVAVVLTSAAMSMQTQVIRHLAGTAVAAIYQTGAIARMGEAVGRVVARAGRLREEREVVVLLFVLAAYAGDAAVGAAAPGAWRWSMALATGVVAALALVWTFVPRPFAGAERA
jgi:uncharacterized membrane protein YoaK (UPF0700 family)